MKPPMPFGPGRIPTWFLIAMASPPGVATITIPPGRRSFPPPGPYFITAPLLPRKTLALREGRTTRVVLNLLEVYALIAVGTAGRRHSLSHSS